MGSGNRQFVTIDPGTGVIFHVFNSRCARTAAKKAATRGYDTAFVVDPVLGKLHVYSTHMRDIREEEKTTFSVKHNLQKKPEVRKMVYRNLGTSNMSISKWNADTVREEIKDVVDNLSIERQS
jgi:hypothetical protein